MSDTQAHRLVQCDWHHIYEDKVSLLADFPALVGVDIQHPGWFSRNGDWAFLATDGPGRDWWKVMVWNNRDPREGLLAMANARVITADSFPDPLS